MKNMFVLFYCYEGKVLLNEINDKFISFTNQLPTFDTQLYKFYLLLLIVTGATHGRGDCRGLFSHHFRISTSLQTYYLYLDLTVDLLFVSRPYCWLTMCISASLQTYLQWTLAISSLDLTLKGPIHDSDFNRNRDVQPDRGCGCCWWSTHTRSDRSVQSFSVESQFSDSNNVGPRLWWPNRPPNIRKFWSTATATATC